MIVLSHCSGEAKAHLHRSLLDTGDERGRNQLYPPCCQPHQCCGTRLRHSRELHLLVRRDTHLLVHQENVQQFRPNSNFITFVATFFCINFSFFQCSLEVRTTDQPSFTCTTELLAVSQCSIPRHFRFIYIFPILILYSISIRNLRKYSKHNVVQA